MISVVLTVAEGLRVILIDALANPAVVVGSYYDHRSATPRQATPSTKPGSDSRGHHTSSIYSAANQSILLLYYRLSPAAIKCVRPGTIGRPVPHFKRLHEHNQIATIAEVVARNQLPVTYVQTKTRLAVGEGGGCPTEDLAIELSGQEETRRHLPASSLRCMAIFISRYDQPCLVLVPNYPCQSICPISNSIHLAKVCYTGARASYLWPCGLSRVGTQHRKRFPDGEGHHPLPELVKHGSPSGAPLGAARSENEMESLRARTCDRLMVWPQRPLHAPSG
jgi:hypothetical protein